MSFRPMIIISALTTGALAAIGAIAHDRLPVGTRLPVHWNAAGIADRFADAGHALMLPAILCAGISLAVIPAIEPMQIKLDRSTVLYRTAWIGLLAIMALTELVIAAPAFHLHLPAFLPLAGVGLLLVLIGNALPKSRPGFFVGIRTPWTLTDTDNWVATHRLGGWTMILGGLVVVAAAFLPLPGTARALAVKAAIGIAVAPPILYSWLRWRRDHRA